MTAVSLIMPMAGRGSRFAKEGAVLPKPLIELAGRPFFWWAAESARRALCVAEMVFVVLEEHRAAFGIDERIREHYPDANIIGLPDVTSGAAETARLGVESMAGGRVIAVNDCDHAFSAPSLASASDQLAAGDAASALLCFRSQNPAYSYVRLDGTGEVVGTVEKRAVSSFAIAGCYLFRNASAFLSVYDEYCTTCAYDELFISGLVNVILSREQRVVKAEADSHWSFGTPEERARLDITGLERTFLFASGST